LMEQERKFVLNS